MADSHVNVPKYPSNGVQIDNDSFERSGKTIQRQRVNAFSVSVKSDINSTSTPLGIGETFTGTAEDNTYNDVMVSCKTDADCTIYMDFSVDGGVNWDSSIPFSVSGGVGEFHTLVKGPRAFRVRVVNGAVAQTYLRLMIAYGEFRAPTSGLSSTIQQDSDALTVRSITEESFTAEGKYSGRTIVNKFGRNADVDAAEDIWGGGADYTGFPTGSAETVNVFSSDANDTSAGTGARTIRLYGLDANYDVQTEDITLNGITAVTTTKTWMRLNRAILLTAGSNGTNIGIITARHTTTTANVFMAVPAGYGQTQVAAYTIPAGYTGYLRGYNASMLDNTANQALIGIWVREFGKATRILRPFAISTAYSVSRSLPGGIVLPEKTDLKVRALSVLNTNADITASFDIYLVKN